MHSIYNIIISVTANWPKNKMCHILTLHIISFYFLQTIFRFLGYLGIIRTDFKISRCAQHIDSLQRLIGLMPIYSCKNY